MAEEIAFENNLISNFKGLVTLTLTSDQVILHTVVHHSSTVGESKALHIRLQLTTHLSTSKGRKAELA